MVNKYDKRERLSKVKMKAVVLFKCVPCAVVVLLLVADVCCGSAIKAKRVVCIIGVVKTTVT